MESGLLTMEDAADKETINTIFRAAHSIKGGAGTFGFMEISGFTHSVETLLDEMRNGARGVTPDAVQVLLQSVDVIREMIQSAQAKQPIVMTGANASERRTRTSPRAERHASRPRRGWGIPCQPRPECAATPRWRPRLPPRPSAQHRRRSERIHRPTAYWKVGASTSFRTRACSRPATIPCGSSMNWPTWVHLKSAPMSTRFPR